MLAAHTAAGMVRPALAHSPQSLRASNKPADKQPLSPHQAIKVASFKSKDLSDDYSIRLTIGENNYIEIN